MYEAVAEQAEMWTPVEDLAAVQAELLHAIYRVLIHLAYDRRLEPFAVSRPGAEREPEAAAGAESNVVQIRPHQLARFMGGG